jgi:hypothetical protein
MIGVNAARTEEPLPLRVRLRGLGTIGEAKERRDHQQGLQIHLTEEEISPKNRSHPSDRAAPAQMGLRTSISCKQSRTDKHEPQVTELYAAFSIAPPFLLRSRVSIT